MRTVNERSSKTTFVAWVSIHRWTEVTLHTLLADHLMPEQRRRTGELDDLRKSRADSKSKSALEKRITELTKLFDELTDFIEKVTDVADNGAPPSDPSTTKREVSTRFEMDLNDGVMVNSAALWALLEPQWKDPKKWWRELACAKGKKDYDWSHLAARYFSTRVEAKCVTDPSLAVAHKCFWRLHPAKAYQWELRLQNEIGPEFLLTEPDSVELRAKWLKAHASEAKELVAAELKRRERKLAKSEDGDTEGESDGPLLDGTANEPDDDGDE